MPATTPRRAAHGADGRAGPELLVVEVSLGSSARDHDLRVRFLDRRYRLLRLGTDGDVHTAQALVRRWSELADQVAVMQAGRIVEQGACADVLYRPVHDYTRTMLAAVPRLPRPS